MSITRNSSEGGTDAVTVTTGNSGGGSGNAWDTVSLNGGDVEYDSAQFAHGVLSHLFQPLTGAITEVRRNFPTPDTTAMLSFYIRTLAAPFSVTSTIAQLRHGSAATGFVQLMDTTQRFRVQEVGGLSVFTSATLANSTWYRCELREIMGTATNNGTLQFAYYTLAAPTTPVETPYSSAVRNTGIIATHTNYQNCRYGRCSSATSDVTTFNMDSFQELTGADAASLGVDWPPVPPAASVPLVYTATGWR